MCEYDISPYTNNITGNENPQQAILDWILRETGKDMWFNQPMGMLNADRNRIYVYHTPEIQNVVRTIVDRFVHTRGQLQTIDLKLVTVEKPNWRSDVYAMLQPVEVQTPGVEAWLVSKENAAMLLSQLSRAATFNNIPAVLDSTRWSKPVAAENATSPICPQFTLGLQPVSELPTVDDHDR